MIPQPIEHQDPKAPVPKCELRPDEFRVYARRAKWHEEDVELLLKDQPPKLPFMCGWREVRLLV